MSVSRELSVLITKKYFLKIPYAYLIFQVGQIKILGQANTCLFKKKTKKTWPFHTTDMAKIRISEFSAKNNFCPTVYLLEGILTCKLV